MTVHVKVAANGRLVLPAALRQRMGLQHGGELILEETDHGVLLRTSRQSIQQARSISRQFLGDKDASVAAFLAERRQVWDAGNKD